MTRQNSEEDVIFYLKQVSRFKVCSYDEQYAWEKLLRTWNPNVEQIHNKMRFFVQRSPPNEVRKQLWKILLNTDDVITACMNNNNMAYSNIRESLNEILHRNGVVYENFALNEEFFRNNDYVGLDFIGANQLSDICKDLRRQYSARWPDKDLTGRQCSARGQGRSTKTAVDRMISSHFAILLCYVRENPRTGYFQFMSSLVYILLLLMNEKDAFWSFVILIESKRYMKMFTSDQGLTNFWKTFDVLLQRRMPKLHLELMQINPEIQSYHSQCFFPGWVLKLFGGLPCLDTVLAIWDHVLLNGYVALLQVSLALCKVVYEWYEKNPNPKSILELLCFPPQERVRYEVLMPEVWKTSLDEAEVNKILEKVSADEDNASRCFGCCP